MTTGGAKEVCRPRVGAAIVVKVGPNNRDVATESNRFAEEVARGAIGGRNRAELLPGHGIEEVRRTDAAAPASGADECNVAADSHVTSKGVVGCSIRRHQLPQLLP